MAGVLIARALPIVASYATMEGGKKLLMAAGASLAGYMSYQTGGAIARQLGYQEYEKPKFSRMRKVKSKSKRRRANKHKRKVRR